MEPFEIEPSYDREDPFGQGPRVLWGRVAILAGVVVFAFLIGRLTAGGGGGGSTNDTSSLQSQINSLRSQNNQLQAALQASNSGTSTGSNSGSQTGTNTVPTSTAAPSPSAPASASTLGPNGTTYTVKPGDSLIGIEEHFYHAFGQAYTTAIEQANQMSSTAIRAGQTLTIPPATAINTSGAGTTSTSTSPVTTPSAPATHPSPTSTRR